MKDKTKIYKIYMIFGITLLVIALISSTFAYYVWNTDTTNETKIVTNVGGATVYFDGGSAIENASIRPVESKDYGIKKDISVKSNTTGLTFNLYLDLTTLPDGLKDSTFKFALYNGTTLKKEGNFSTSYITSNATTCEKNSTTHITLLNNETISTSKVTYTLYIWIDGEAGTNPNSMMNQSFTFNIHAEGVDAVLNEGRIPDITTYPEDQKQTLAYKILSDYYYADKSDISNNGVTYHYDTTHNLMADIGSNVRYYGANPNNYIYFNCSDYSNQTDTTCEKWRIIGVFNGKVKIIRSSNIGTYAWDNKLSGVGTSTSSYGSNNWSDSRLMIMLNPTDYSSSFSTDIYAYDKGSYWYGLSSTCYAGSSSGTKACDFTSIGLKNDTTRNLISTETYYINGYNSSSVYSDIMYEEERAGNTWNGKIALAYPSDYGYAVDFNYCTKNLYNYNNSTCTSNNWMKNIITNNGNTYGWLLTPHSSSAGSAWVVLSSGSVHGNFNPSNAYGVAPVLSLNSVLSVETGTGESGSPYKLSIG